MFSFVLYVGSSYLADSCLHLFKWFIIKNTPILFCSHNRTYSRLCFDHLGEVCVDISMQSKWAASDWMTHSCCQDLGLSYMSQGSSVRATEHDLLHFFSFLFEKRVISSDLTKWLGSKVKTLGGNIHTD